MVSRLVFKGDKFPAGVRKVKEVKKKTTTKVNESLKHKIDIEQLETSWISALSVRDVKGPIVLAFEIKDEGINVLSVESMGNVVKNQDITYQESTVPIKGLDKESKLNQVQPNAVSQVFITVSVNGPESSSKLALKSADGKYLSPEGPEKVGCYSEAICESQLWEFKPVQRSDGMFFKLLNNGRRLSYQDGVKLVDDEDSENDLWTVRVQMKNTTIGKQILSDLAIEGGKDTNTIKDAVDSLHKLGIEITPETIKRLQNAADSGKINEQVIFEKQSTKTDSRC